MVLQKQAIKPHSLEDPAQATSILVGHVLPKLQVVGAHFKLGLVVAVLGARLIQAHLIGSLLLVVGPVHTVYGPLLPASLSVHVEGGISIS